MEKETKNKKETNLTHIEITWDDQQDLIDLGNSEEFTNFILIKSYEAIEKAIEDNLPKVDLFNIFNLSLIIELDRKHFKSVLEKITNIFLEEENYEECSKIKQLIEKI